MPKPPGTHDPYKWTLDLPPGSQCSIGWSRNEHVDNEGKSSGGRQNEDRYYTCTYQDKIQLYMVLDGHDGTRACDFVQKHLPFSVLRSDLDRGDIDKALTNSFRSTEREFFIGIDPHITRRLTLVIEIQQKAENSRQASILCPQQVDEIDHLDNQIKGGTTVVLGLIYNNQLYIANVGDSRALLCSYSQYDGGKLNVEQLSIDHNTSNDLELRRLAECGLDPTKLRKAKRLGYQQNTRSIGDYSIKGGYSDVEEISKATREPGTAEPYISRPINLLNFCGFLILMSDGLYEAYEAWTGRPQFVNDDIAHLVAEEMKKTSDLSVVAQNVVEKVKHLFRSTCRDGRRSGRLDDITLIIRNLGYPMAFQHTHSFPADIANSSASSVSGSGLSTLQDPPRLQPSISYPSHVHGYPPQYGGPFYHAAGPAPGAGYHSLAPINHTVFSQTRSDPAGYGATTQAHMSLATSAIGVVPPHTDRVQYPPPQFPTSHSGLQMDPQNRHLQAGFDSTPPRTNLGYNQGYYNEGRGGYPINYHQSPQQPLGSGDAGQHQRSHQPLMHTASEPKQQPPPHPASTKRIESSPYPPGPSQHTNVSPEHGSGGQQGARRRYENIPLNTIKEATDSEVSSSPMKHFDGGAPHGAVYENVVLRLATNTMTGHLHPGGAAPESLLANRYSDSCLAEKVHEVCLADTKSGVGSSSTPSMESLAPRPRSAEPSHRVTGDNLSSISALPGWQPPNTVDEDYLLYGWTKTSDDQSSISTLKSNLSSSETPSMSGASQPPSLSTMTGDETKTPMPLNGEVRQLGSSTHEEAPASLPDSEPTEEDEDDDDEGVLVMDMSDYSEASEAEDGEEIDTESGEIRAYIKNWGKLPLDLSWEEV